MQFCHLHYGHTLCGTLTWVIYRLVYCLENLIFFIDLSYCFMYCHVCAILSLLKICRDHPCIWSGTIFRAHFSLDNGLELVWTMVWNLSDQGSLRSGIRLSSGVFERTSSAQSSDQTSLRSGTVWSEVPLVRDGLIRGDFERDLNLGTPFLMYLPGSRFGGEFM